jgi:ribosomal protein S18 acetylase RimI-like enzyme
MAIVLKSMTQSEFKEYKEFLIKDYARENVEAGYWDEADSEAQSRKAVEGLLPEGITTPNHYIYTVRNDDARVGVIWMRATQDAALKSGFIFDITIETEHRGKGYGRQAMHLIEAKARELGLTQIGLHVFANNSVARKLYESLGYETKSMNMTKNLA